MLANFTRWVEKIKQKNNTEIHSELFIYYIQIKKINQNKNPFVNLQENLKDLKLRLIFTDLLFFIQVQIVAKKQEILIELPPSL